MEYDLSKRIKKTPESWLLRIYRKTSYPLTWLLVKTPLTPNQISLISFFIAVPAAIIFTYPGYKYTLLAGILTELSFMFDLSDGEVARVKGISSVRGIWLEHILDQLKDVVLFIGITVGLFKQDPGLSIFIIALLATLSTTVLRFFKIVTSLYYERITFPKVLRIYDISAHYTIIFVGAIFNQMLFVLYYFAFIVNFLWIYKIFITLKKAKPLESDASKIKTY